MATTEAVMTASAVNTKEEQDAAIVDIPNAVAQRDICTTRQPTRDQWVNFVMQCASQHLSPFAKRKGSIVHVRLEKVL